MKLFNKTVTAIFSVALLMSCGNVFAMQQGTAPQPARTQAQLAQEVLLIAQRLYIECAAERPAVATINYLLSQSAQRQALNTVITSQDKHGDTPLLALVKTHMSGQSQIAQLLINAGANVHHENEAGDSALSLAVEHNDDALVRELWACGAKAQSAEEVEFIQTLGLPIETQQTLDGALNNQFMKPSLDLKECLALLRRGANPNYINSRGESILSGAVFFNSPEYVRLLLQFRANPNLISKAGGTSPFSQAVENGRNDIAQQLYLAGALPSTPKDYEFTNNLLNKFIAAASTLPTSITPLPEPRTQPSAETDAQKADAELQKFLEELDEESAKLTRPELEFWQTDTDMQFDLAAGAMSQGFAGFKRYLTENPRMIAVRQHENRNTLLHIATAIKNQPVISLLLQRGLQPTVENTAGETPWSLAYKANDAETMGQFVKHGFYKLPELSALATTQQREQHKLISAQIPGIFKQIYPVNSFEICLPAAAVEAQLNEHTPLHIGDLQKIVSGYLLNPTNYFRNGSISQFFPDYKPAAGKPLQPAREEQKKSGKLAKFFGSVKTGLKNLTGRRNTIGSASGSSSISTPSTGTFSATSTAVAPTSSIISVPGGGAIHYPSSTSTTYESSAPSFSSSSTSATGTLTWRGTKKGSRSASISSTHALTLVPETQTPKPEEKKRQ